jgi:Tfp pilus assembly protein PilO
MARRTPTIRDFDAPRVPVWPRVVLALATITVVTGIGWTVYINSSIGQCHAQAREVGQFRFGVSLKQMMNLPIHDADRDRFDDLCRLYTARCFRHPDAQSRAICRPI